MRRSFPCWEMACFEKQPHLVLALVRSSLLHILSLYLGTSRTEFRDFRLSPSQSFQASISILALTQPLLAHMNVFCDPATRIIVGMEQTSGYSTL